MSNSKFPLIKEMLHADVGYDEAQFFQPKELVVNAEELEAYFAKAQKVYDSSLRYPNNWDTIKTKNSQNTAILIGIKPIEKAKECEHKGWGDTYRGFKCEQCGINLKPKWEAIND